MSCSTKSVSIPSKECIIRNSLRKAALDTRWLAFRFIRELGIQALIVLVAVVILLGVATVLELTGR